MRRFALLVLSVSLASCTVSPWNPDLIACGATPADVAGRLARHNEVETRQAYVTQRFSLLLSDCWTPEVNVPEQIAACTRAIDSGQLSKVDRANALDCRGNDRTFMSQFDAAITDYDAALRLLPYNADFMLDRGSALVAKGEPGRAIADFNEVIRLNLRYDVAYSNRAAAWLAKGNPSQAMNDANMAIGFERRFAAAYTNRGLAWISTGRFDRAIEDLDVAILLQPDSAMPFVIRGSAWGRKGEDDRAMADYSEAIRLEPHRDVAYWSRAALYSARGDREHADADLQEALRFAGAPPGGAIAARRAKTAPVDSINDILRRPIDR